MIAELSTLGAMATLHRALIEGLLNMMNRLLLWSVKTNLMTNDAFKQNYYKIVLKSIRCCFC